MHGQPRMNGRAGRTRFAGAKAIAITVLCVGIIGGLWYWVDANREAVRRETEQKDRAIQAEYWGAGPTQGTEEAWLAYVDERIAETMKRRGNLLEISLGNGATYRVTVSLNWP